MKKNKDACTVNIILRDPNDKDARRCRDCECINKRGYCDNYHLYAVMRQMCKQPVEEAL